MKKYFSRLPHIFKVFFTNIYGFFLFKKRYTKSYYDTLKFYISKDKLEITSFRYDLFKNQLLGNKFFTIKKSILEYPVINKEFIKEHYDEIINKNAIDSYLYTSGTTGSGLKFPISKKFIEHQWAIFGKFRATHNCTLDKTWFAYVIGQTLFDIKQKKPPFSIKSFSTKQLLLSQYHLNRDSVKYYINDIIRNKIKYLHAYPSVLNNFANLIREEKLQDLAKQIGFILITTSSEKLFDYQRKNIEDIFSCKVREIYGLTEGVVNIFECEKGSLHIDESYSHVELLPEDIVKKEYKIIGTSYHNKAFPLIRYDTRDTCIYDANDTCECGRKSRVIREILGRNEDYLILDDGIKIGRLDHIFKSMVNVKEAQIYQKEKGSAIFNIVKTKNYNISDENELISEIKSKLGSNFIFEIKYLTNIVKTKSGKLKFVVSEIDREELNV